MNLLWIDVETTGLDKHRNGIIQIAGIVEVDGTERERFNLQMNPEAELDPVSQTIHGISQAEISGYPSRQETFDRFTSILLRYVRFEEPNTRFCPAGYNVRFDIGFLDQWFRSMREPGLGAYFRRERVDPSAMMKALQEYLGKRKMPSWSLRAVASQMGLSFGERHDALEDVEMTREIHHRIVGLLSSE